MKQSNLPNPVVAAEDSVAALLKLLVWGPRLTVEHHWGPQKDTVDVDNTAAIYHNGS